MSRPVYLSPTLGTPLLLFLWRWKLVSTAALMARFFPETQSANTVYNWLLKLKHSHYIDVRRDERGEYTLWSLETEGFRAIEDLLPPLKESGYRSESPNHDWLASAFHMGAWYVKPPVGVEVFSEQQLRRYEIDEYLPWVPTNQAHRPDGYWHYSRQGAAKTVALEMEITRKKLHRYQSIGSFYGESAQINRVIWVVRKLSDAMRILEQLSKGPGSKPAMHSFVFLHSFQKQAWSAVIAYGAGKQVTVESFLLMSLGISNEAISGPSEGHGPAMALLETRIKRFHTATSGTRREGHFSQQTTASAVVAPAPHETRLIVQPEVSR